MNVVVIPTAHRPEFLALALEYLFLIPNCPKIIISADYVPEKRDEILHVYDTYAPVDSDLIFQSEHIPVHSGTWNILQSIKLGYNTGAENVFLVEEDVMVFPNWLDWHLAQMATGEYVASCGRLRASTLKYLGQTYTNPGSCLSRKLLDQLVPHINDIYFEGTGLYCEKVFGQASWAGSSLDDGLIRAVIAGMGGKVAYPANPVAAHQGWQGYELGLAVYANHGDIRTRIAGLRKLIAKIQPGERYARDFEFYDPR